MRQVNRRCAALLLAALLPASALSAAEIRGKATDATGAILGGARVTLENVATGALASTTTDAAGHYAFANVDVGIYRVALLAQGFNEDARNVSVLGAQAALDVNFALAVGNLQSAVTVTASRSARDSLVVPLRAESIGGQDLTAANPTSTGEAMVQAPGITLVGSGPFQTRPRLRGLDSTRVLVLVDGERLNNARTATDRAGVEVGLVDTTAIESVEVVSGAGSVLYGTDALSGTINILTAQPRFSDARRFYAGLNGFYSSNENGARGSLNVGLSGSKYVIEVAGGLESYDDYQSGGKDGDVLEDTRPLHADGTLTQADTIDTNFPPFDFNAFPEAFNAPYVRTTTTVPASASDGSYASAMGLFQLAENKSLRLKYMHREAEDVGFPDFAPPQFFQGIVLPHSKLDKFSARFNARSLTPWFSSLTATAYYQHQDRLLRNIDIPVQFPVPSPRFFPINVFKLTINSDTGQEVKTWGFDLQNTFLISPKNVLTAGFTLYQDDSADYRTSSTQTSIIGQVALGARGPAAVVFPTPLLLGPPTVSNPVRVPNATFQDFGIFAQDEWDLSSRLRLVAGLRGDFYQVKTEATPGYNIDAVIAGARPPIDPATLPDANGDEVSRDALTGDVGLVFRVNDKVSALAHYGRSYRHPNLEELLFAGPATIGSIAPNITVGPEKGDNLDFGVKVRTPRGSGSISYFNNKYTGFISTEITAVTASSSVSQAINFADLRIQGVEADAEVPFEVKGAILTLFANAAYNHGQVLSGENALTGDSLDDTPADNITPLKAVGGLRLSDKRGRLWLEYSFRHQKEVERVAPTLIDSPFLIAQDLYGLNGFTLHHVGAGWEWRREGQASVTLTVNGENLGNKFYREQFQFAPARGRSFTFGVHVRKL